MEQNLSCIDDPPPGKWGSEPGPRGADNPRGARRSFYVDMVLFPDVREPAASLLKSFTPVGTV